MPVTILAPMSGDTVSNPVTITSGYYALSSDDVICKIAAKPDNQETLDADGVHSGSGINGVPFGPQTVEVFVNGTLQDSQEGVIVSDGPIPVPIEGLDGPETIVKENDKKITVRGGKVPNGSTAAYVVCQAIEVDVATRKFTVAATGAVSLNEDKKWAVTLKLKVKDADKNIQYVVRAFAYDKHQRLIGSRTAYAKQTP